MADDFVRSLLQEINVDDFTIQRFEEQGIDKEAFSLLEDKDLENLVEKVGIRVKIKKKIKDILENNTSSNSSGTASTTSLEGLPTVILDSFLMPPPENADLTNIIFKESEDYEPLKDKKQINLVQLLQASNTGLCILNKYKCHKSFSKRDRDTLTDIIIQNELSVDQYRITRDRFNEIAEEIISVFPTENKDTYFYIQKVLRNGKLHNIGKGKLFVHYYKVRNKLTDGGVIKKPTSIKPSLADTVQEIEIDVDTEECIRWLKNNTLPKTTLIEKWKKTHKCREAFLKTEYGGKITDYFSEYPALKLPDGYTLLEYDFEVFYPDASNAVQLNWKNWSQIIIAIAKQEKSNTELQSLIQIYDDKDSNDEAKFLASVLTIPYILPSVTVRRQSSKKRTWRPSRLETQEGFIKHFKVIAEIETFVSFKLQKLKDYSLSFQPMIFVIGKSLNEIESTFVRVDSHMYSLESAIEGFDVCFKLIHALHATYSAEAEQCWLLIQKTLYNISTEWDKNFTGINIIINRILNDLNCS